MKKIKFPFGISLVKKPIAFHSRFAISAFLNNRYQIELTPMIRSCMRFQCLDNQPFIRMISTYLRPVHISPLPFHVSPFFPFSCFQQRLDRCFDARATEAERVDGPLFVDQKYRRNPPHAIRFSEGLLLVFVKHLDVG